MIELAEALEKYTVVQLIFAFLLLLPTWAIVRELRIMRTGSGDDNAIDTAKIIAETLGGIIANELDKVASSVRDDQQTNTQEHQGIVGALNEHGKIMESVVHAMRSVVTLITEHDDKSETFRQAIGDLVGGLSGDLVKTNRAVEVMNTDIETIKSDLETVKNAVEHLKAKGLSLDAASLATMNQFIEAAETLGKQLSKVTQETPEVESRPVVTISRGEKIIDKHILLIDDEETKEDETGSA